MKKTHKILAKALLCTSLVGFASPLSIVYANQTNSNPEIQEISEQSSATILTDENGDFTVNGIQHTYSYTDEVSQLGQKLEQYFYLDNNGNVRLSGTEDELSNVLGISKEDARLLLEYSESLPNIYDRGFVGLTLRLGPTVRSMSGVLAGGFAAGYCGWYLKQFAVNPATAGVVGAISAGIGGAVGWAVSHGIRTVDVGVNVPAVSMRLYVNVP